MTYLAQIFLPAWKAQIAQPTKIIQMAEMNEVDRMN